MIDEMTRIESAVHEHDEDPLVLGRERDAALHDSRSELLYRRFTLSCGKSIDLCLDARDFGVEVRFIGCVDGPIDRRCFVGPFLIRPLGFFFRAGRGINLRVRILAQPPENGRWLWRRLRPRPAMSVPRSQGDSRRAGETGPAGFTRADG